MSSNETTGRIEHISDTALWVAVYRAQETERKDALFSDPFAKVLAGERGPQIVKKIPGGRAMGYIIIVRTKVLDEIILNTIQKEKIDTVINLAAGLDTRPYRLPLPPDLRWIEVDLPKITQYKTEKLMGYHPVCRLERIVQDLSDLAGRRDLFTRINQESKKVLVISEGILVYLEENQVTGLADDLRAQDHFKFWTFDFVTPFLLKMIQKNIGKHLESSPMVSSVDPELKFFEKSGWMPAEIRYAWTETMRLKRLPKIAPLWNFFFLFMSKEKKAIYRRMSGYALLNTDFKGPFRK